MKSKILFSGLILFLSVFTSHAQDSVTPSTVTEPMYKQDLGFNTNFIFDGIFRSEQTPFTVMYKKYSSQNQALRLGVQLNFSSERNDAEPTNVNPNYSSIDLQFAIGKEFQRSLPKNWTWYYGGDLVPIIQTATAKYKDPALLEKLITCYYGLGARPFLGIRYNISPRLYVSAEASIFLVYGKRKEKEKYRGEFTPNIERDRKTLNLSMKPASGIFVYYRF
jgi:hypothetical protein